MLWVENLASIESEGRRLGLAARREPSLEVPQYPGWTLEALISHTASMHGRTTRICRELPNERIPAPQPPEGIDVFAWYDSTLDEMLTALTESDAATPVWAFSPSPTIGFWERRMVIETGIHRWDAYQALGEEDRLTDRVAISGLDEFAEMWLPRLDELPPLRVIADDLGTVWDYGPGEPREEVHGTASDVYLRLMSRPSPVVLPQLWSIAVDSLTPPPR